MALHARRPCWECAHCSTIVCPEPAADGLRVTAQPGHVCPLCNQTLLRAVIDDRDHIEVCERCKGILMGREVFAVTLTARRRAALTPAVVPPPADRDELRRRIDCPRCAKAMLTDWYGGPGNIVIDTCSDCDVVWLDAGELRQVIDAPGRDRRA